MKLMDLKGMTKDMPLMGLKATIKKVYAQEVKTGVDKVTKKPKSWTQQNLVLEDESGTLYAQLTDCPNIDSDQEGQPVEMSCRSGSHGLTGVKVGRYTNSKQEEVTNIRITKSALFQIGGIHQAPEVPNKPETPTTGAIKSQESKPVVKSKVSDNERFNKRAMCLSYSKDLCLGAKIKVEDITKKADEFVDYVFGSEVDKQTEALARSLSEEEMGSAIEPEYTTEIEFGDY